MKVRVDAQTKDGKKFAQMYDITEDLLAEDRAIFEKIAAERIEQRYAHEPVSITGIKVLDQPLDLVY